MKKKSGLDDHSDQQEFKNRLRSDILGHYEAALTNCIRFRTFSYVLISKYV